MLAWWATLILLSWGFIACKAKPERPQFEKKKVTDVQQRPSNDSSDDSSPSPIDTPPVQPNSESYSLRFHDITWLTSHNAFVNNEDAFWIASNQSKSLKRQLEDGVSALMLDIHSYEGEVVLCHGGCSGLPGIHPRQAFSKALSTIVDHMRANPEVIITIFLEDYTSREEFKAELDAIIGLRDLIFDPYQWEVTTKGWPKISDLLVNNKRLLLISDKDDKKDLGVGFGPEFTVENYWSIGLLGTKRECVPRWENIPLDKSDGGFQRLFVMNHFRDIPTKVASALDNSWDNIWGRMEEECLGAAKRKPNFLAVDFYDTEGDGPKLVVSALNEAAAIAFKDVDYKGGGAIMKPGSYRMEELGDKAIHSLKVLGGGKVKLYSDDAFSGQAMTLTIDHPRMPQSQEKPVSSMIIEKIKPTLPSSRREAVQP